MVPPSHAAFLAVPILCATAIAQPPAAPAKPEPGSRPTEKPAPAAPATGRIDLRPRWELGQVVRYTMKQVSNQQTPNAEDPKNPHLIRQEETTGLKMTAKAVDAATGEATVEIVYETVKVKFESDLATVEFDSTRPPPKTPAKPADPLDAIDGMIVDQFKQKVGTTITMKVAKDGRILSTSGGESLSPSIPGLPSAADAMKQLGGLIGPITTNSSAGFDGTAKVGDRWTHRDQLTAGPIGDLDLTTTYDLRSHGNDVAKVYFKGHAEGKNSTGQLQLASVDSADHSGMYSWDTRKGQLVRCEMEQKVAVSSALTGGKPATSTTTLVIERTDRKDPPSRPQPK